MTDLAYVSSDRTYRAQIAAMQRRGMSMTAIRRVLGLSEAEAVRQGIIDPPSRASGQPAPEPPRKRPPGVNGGHAVIYDLLVDAAEEGVPCPSDASLANEVGYSGHVTANRAVQALHESGHIQIERNGRARRVLIAETGNRTDWSRLGGHDSRSA